MTVNIVVFIDCYSTIYSFYYVHLLKKKNKRRMRILGALYFLSFLAGKLRHFERSFEKLKLAHACFSKFFGGKITNFEQGFGEKKMTKNRSDLMSKIA